MLLLENFKLAIFSIKSNKMRAFLTMLGIIIGITSVISISSLGEASKSILNKEFASYNKNLAVIYPDYSKDISEEHLFTKSEINLINQKFEDKIEFLEPSANESSHASYLSKKLPVSLFGVSNNYVKMEKINIIEGRFIKKSDVDSRKYVAVIDYVLADKLWGAKNSIGKEIKVIIEGVQSNATVIGVYKQEPSIFASLITSDSTKMYLPNTLFPNTTEYNFTLQFKIADKYSDKNSEIANEVAKFIQKIKGLENYSYNVQTLEDQQNQMNAVLGTVSLAIGAISAISLIVGGIGIMNIMLVSVTERTREIGIRKSLGAKRKDILLQFLIESMIVSSIGGFIGITLGVAFSLVVSAFMKIPPPITITSIIGTVLFSAAVGIFFGLYPANKAAKLDPIDALRYE